MYNSLDKLKPKTKTKNQIFFVADISTLLYTLKRRTRKLFSPSKKMFSCPPYSKCIKKLLNFQLHQQKIFWFLVFSFRFWFQFTQRIEKLKCIFINVLDSLCRPILLLGFNCLGLNTHFKNGRGTCI